MIFYVLGYIVIASAHSVGTIAAGIILYAVYVFFLVLEMYLVTDEPPPAAVTREFTVRFVSLLRSVLESKPDGRKPKKGKKKKFFDQAGCSC